MTPSPRLTIASVRRARLFRVVLLYGSASFVVLQVCDIFVSHLGLPGWVFPSALLLLIIGLPLVLATAVVYEAQEAYAVEDDAASSAADGSRQADGATETAARTRSPVRLPAALSRLTWRRTLLTGTAAFAVLFVVVGAYAGSRTTGLGPFATLMGAGVLGEQEVLILAEFESRAADRDMGRTVTEAVRVDLAQSGSITLLEGERVREALQRMARRPDEPLTMELARELAVREGVKAIVTGEVASAGTGYILVGRVIAAADGSTLVAVRETADTDATLISAIDRLSRALRERIGEPLRSLAARPPLTQTTTSSLQALQLYARALRVVREDPARALPVLREAVALDSGFVAAWFHLGMALEQTGAPTSMVRDALVRGAAHLDRLPGMERYLFDGIYQWRVQGDREARRRAHETMVELYPDNPTALANLAATLLDARDPVRAAALVEPLLDTPTPSLLAVVQMAHALIQQNRPDSALAVLQRVGPELQAHPVILRFRLSAAGAGRDYARVEEEAQRLLESSSGAGTRIVALGALAAVAAQRGQERELQRLLDRVAGAVREFEMLQPGTEPAFILFWRAARKAVREGDRAGLREWLAAMPALEPADSGAAIDRPYVTLAQAHALAGDLAGARACLELARRWWPEGQLRAEEAGVRIAEALIDLEEGRLDAAEAVLMETRFAECPGCLLPLVARAREATGDRGRALEVWNAYDERARFLNSLYYDALWVPELYEARARLMLRLGDRTGAARELRRALAAFADADPVHADRVAGWLRELRRLE